MVRAAANGRKPGRVDFFIGNPGHHVQMFAPVIRILEMHGASCRIISLCEFRGFVTPVPRTISAAVQCRRVMPFRIRKSPTLGSQPGTAAASVVRRMARAMSWRTVLRVRLESLLREQPDVAVLPNDAAFPYNLIARMLKDREVPFVLVQEGIRFGRPAAGGAENYGSGGASAFAVWGETSAAYFRACGVPKSVLHVTGNPRFDEIDGSKQPAAKPELERQLKQHAKNLLLLTNPIDDQGFCTTEAKLTLVRRFAAGLRPLLEDPTFHLTVKPHARESLSAYGAALSGVLQPERWTVTEAPLHTLFRTASAAIVLASTVGLEALLAGLPLGVLEIPGHGFVHDYVGEGAALGIGWSAPIAPQVRILLSRGVTPPPVDHYLARSLCLTGNAAGRVAGLVELALHQTSSRRAAAPIGLRQWSNVAISTHDDIAT
jgi:hypothetical protein